MTVSDRKIISVAYDSELEYIYVVCDDGSFWKAKHYDTTNSSVTNLSEKEAWKEIGVYPPGADPNKKDL